MIHPGAFRNAPGGRCVRKVYLLLRIASTLAGALVPELDAEPGAPPCTHGRSRRRFGLSLGRCAVIEEAVCMAERKKARLSNGLESIFRKKE
jgi:hypothetical protein